MGSHFALSLLVLLAFPVAGSALTHEPKIVTVPLKRAFIPPGFDDNDRAQIVVSGQFPNSCYKVGPARIERDDRARTIQIHQTAYVYRGLCFDVALPFSRVVDLGILTAGHYKVVDGNGAGTLGQMSVARATSDSSDDSLYAPVYDAFPYSDKKDESMLFLAGTFPAQCLKLEKVEVKYHSDVIEVLPIADLRKTTDADCRPVPVPFTHRLRLKDGLKGTYLVHVRSMDGQSVNKLTEFPLPNTGP